MEVVSLFKYFATCFSEDGIPHEEVRIRVDVSLKFFIANV